MSSLVSERPPEFSDDERWWRFFTKKMLLCFLGSCAVGYLIVRLMAMVHLVFLGLLIALILVTATMIAVCLPYPSRDVLGGARHMIDDILFCIVARGRKPHLYVKTVGGDEDED